ncbi:hypothetical protein K523DRAFT_238664 [Schizophyllum commune Tattone D]|nr:hypothetical protein K525DRAFT_241423 [Schizophyllum commune Loenen D]KAI5830932.1 hypothetical protein K523DRAFT_238664 [Schizophyllum commune Tattone D]
MSPQFDEKPYQARTLGQRLKPTIDAATRERNRAARKARISGWAINIAIGLQVTLGTLTTMLSAITVGRETSIVTAVLGGLATLVASYSARVRGTDEPEASLRRVKDMELFIRECEAFQTDHFHVVDDPHLEAVVRGMRRRFEEFMGNGPEHQ